MSNAVGPCLNCGQPNTGITQIAGFLTPPKAGDVTICVKCMSLQIFTGVGLEVRLPDPVELAQIMQDDRIRYALAVLAERKAMS